MSPLWLVPLGILFAWRWWGTPAPARAEAQALTHPEARATLGRPDDAVAARALMRLRKRLDLRGRALPTSSAGDMVVTVLVVDTRGAPAAGVTVDGSLLTGDLLETPAPVLTDPEGKALLRVPLPLGGKATGLVTATSGTLSATSDPILVSYPSRFNYPVQILLAERALVHGSVLMDGHPVAGATLEVRSYVRGYGGDAVAARGVTSKDGRFELALAAPGSYRVTADYQGVTSEVQSLSLQKGQRESTMDVPLDSQQLTVAVRDPEGQPLAGVALRNRGSDVVLAVTDELGRATVRDSVISGTSQLRFSREGFEDFDDESELPFAQPMLVTMQPALVLAGNVEAPPGALIEVWAQRKGGFDDEGEGYGSGRHVLATLREPGHFQAQLRDGDGEYLLGGYVEGVGEIPERVVELHHGGVVEVGTLQARATRGTVTGIVVDTEGRPLADVNVSAQPMAGKALTQAVTGRDGRFTLDLPVGEQSVTAFLGPRYVGGDSVTVSDEPREMRIQMPACSTWSLPSFDRMGDDGIVVVEGRDSGLMPGDHIVEVDGEAATPEHEVLRSGATLSLRVVRPPDETPFDAAVVPVCIQ